MRTQARLATTVMVLVLAATAASSARVPGARLSGHVLDALDGAERIVPPPGADATPLALTFTLRRDDQPGFDRFLAAVRDPESSEHGRFVEPEALADRFGPSRATYERLARWIESQGLTVVERSTSRMTLGVRGTRAAVARALDVDIRDYRVGERVFFANADGPALPAALAPHVQAVAGLSDLARVQPALKALLGAWNVLPCVLLLSPVPPPPTHKVCNPAVVNAYNFCLTQARAATAAGLVFDFDLVDYPYVTYQHIVPIGEPCPPTPPSSSAAQAKVALPPKPRAASGGGQRVAIVGFDTFVRSDIADYLALIGLPAANLDRLSSVAVNGGATLGPDQDEVLLDVTTVMTVAPGADVVVYHAPFTGAGSFQALFGAAIDGGATVISNSWAYCENETTLADVQSIDALFQTAAAAGISIYNAAGDTGSTCLNGSPNTVAVPAGAPNATAVGGTSPASGDGKPYTSETWWNGAAAVPPTGQGGFGTSRFFTRPSYQDGFTTESMRSVPDVAVGADPAVGTMICRASAGGCPTGLMYGGTSVSAPLMAAFTAVINESLGSNLGFPNAAFYPLAATPAFRGPAALGTDFAHVGLGSPNADRLIVELAGGTIGAVDAEASIVTAALETTVVDSRSVPLEVPADGTSEGFVVVSLLDAARHAVPGKTVTLAADPPGNVVITPANAVTDDLGTVAFRVTNLVAEEVEFSATGDGILLDARTIIPFVVPPATDASIDAFPTTVDADGIATTTITVTLQDALGRPTPGKEVAIGQGNGHSLLDGPSPSVTDSNGQIQFTARNLVNETVTYTAVDVTDGELPIPGSAAVTFSGGTGTACGQGVEPPAGLNGTVITPFATGFLAQNFNYSGVNWGGCPGASVPAFQDDTDAVYVAGFPNGDVYRFGIGGGAVSSGNLLDTVGPTLGWPVFGLDGRLYALRGGTGAGGSGVVVELDPETGAVTRTLASNLLCPASLVVDPLSGDLFFDGSCFGGFETASIFRIVNPAAPAPSTVVYATLPFTANGQLSFAPNGTLYAVTGYNANPDNAPIVRISGTNVAGPPVITTVTGVTSAYQVTVGETTPDGEAKSLIIGRQNELRLVDITTTPPTVTALAVRVGIGGIGPDGCFYGTWQSNVFRVTNASGGCAFTPSNPVPSLTLTPATTTPDPAQGTARELTATFHNVTVPADTPVFFEVRGANPRVQMVRANAENKAVLAYTAQNAGRDVLVASATVGGQTLTSNTARITWTAGPHTTFLTLNPSPTAGAVDVPVVLAASLTDVSNVPPTPVAGATVSFATAGAECTGTTDAAGLATCTLVPATHGTSPLSATFAGTDALLPSSDTVGFAIPALTRTPLGSFLLYGAKATKGTAKTPKFGAVTLADAFSSSGYDVSAPTHLGTPATVDGVAAGDTTHYVGWAIKRAKKSPNVARQSLRVVSACSDATVTAKKPVTVALPSAESPTAPVTVPATSTQDHLLCWQAKAPKSATPKGAQAEVADAFQSTLWDIGKIALVCNPVDKSGAPVIVKGKGKGTPFPITPATIAHPAEHLVCYEAKPAKKRIAQNGCGPATPGDKGTKIKPAQPKVGAQRGIHVANQFAVGQLDTKKATLVCLPATVTRP
jgi:hypothetical protein